MRMTIKVTQEDIDLGVQGSAEECPLAHAINRRAHGCEFSVISGWRGEIRGYVDGTLTYVADQPFWASIYSIVYDVSGKMKPFECIVDYRRNN